MMLKIDDVIQVTAHDIDYQGQGVARYDHQVIFIPGLLTEEEAKIKITELKKQFAQGEIVELIKKSKDRIDHKDTQLGACDLLHLNIEGQHKWQVKITEETFKKIADLEIKTKPVISGDRQTHYRNKVVFHVLPGDRLKLGMYDKNNQHLIPIEQFVLADPHINQALKQLHAKSFDIKNELLRHIAFRTNQQGEILITLVANDAQSRELEPLIEHLKTIDHLVGISLNVQDQKKRILGETSFTLFGINEITETIKDITLYLDDRSFFQINTEVMLKTYDQIHAWVDEGEHVIDAFSGVGGIGFYLSDIAGSILMIDNNAQNTKNAMKTKFIHRIGHVDVLTEDVLKYQIPDRYQTLIVDPPRSGLDTKFIEHITSIQINKIIYLSCDVKTLARDLNMLKTSYDIIEVHPIAMFPQTTSIETLVLLKKK